MFQKLIRTGNSPVGFVLRVTLGVVMLMHGLGQTFGLFGDPGFSGRVAYYHELKGVPEIFAVLGILVISVGAFLLIIGLWGRLTALLNGIFLACAFYLGQHIDNGFFMNWSGKQAGEGFEFHILGIGIAIAIIMYGSGWLSVDRWLMKRSRERTAFYLDLLFTFCKYKTGVMMTKNTPIIQKISP